MVCMYETFLKSLNTLNNIQTHQLENNASYHHLQKMPLHDGFICDIGFIGSWSILA